MNRYYLSCSPPLWLFLLRRGRDRKEISTAYRRDLRERSRERGGATKVLAPVWLLFFGPLGNQGGKPCPRHLCSEAESVIVGYTDPSGSCVTRFA